MRSCLLLVEAGLAALCLATLPFAEHQFYAVPSHGILAETYGGPFLFVAAALVIALWARRGGIGRGLTAGLVASITGFLAAVVISAAHLLDPGAAIGNTSAVLAELCLLVLFFLGPAVIVADWFVHVRERSRLEASDPVFPTARVV